MSNELSYLTGEQAWGFVKIPADDDQARVKAIRALPMDARHELAGLGMHGRKDDSPGFQLCVEFFSEAGLPPSYRPADIQKGLEKLNLTPTDCPAKAVDPNAKPAPLAPPPEAPVAAAPLLPSATSMQPPAPVAPLAGQPVAGDILTQLAEQAANGLAHRSQSTGTCRNPRRTFDRACRPAPSA